MSSSLSVGVIGLQRRNLIAAVSLLTLLQGLLGQFAIHGVPLFLRDAGHSAQMIGLVFLAAIPYVLRFVWAPLVDRFGSRRFGHFRSWIVAGQGVACLMVGALALANPAGNPVVLLMLISLMMICIATQLTATGGLMVEKLAPEDRARGASVQSASAGMAGLLLGACVIYVFGDVGWVATVTALLAVSLAGFLVVGTLRLDAGEAPPAQPGPFWSQLNILKRAETRHLLFVTVLVGLGLVLTYGFKSIVLIDAGYSIAQGGLIGLVFGNAVGIACALAIRPLVDRWGGFACLCLVGALAAVYCVVFSALYAAGLSKTSAAAFVVIANGLTFAAFTASRTLMMGLCSSGNKATELATFVSLEGLCVLLFAGVGNFLAGHIGFSSVMLVAAVGSAAGGLLSWRMASQARNPSP